MEGRDTGNEREKRAQGGGEAVIVIVRERWR